jgi:hypothetical protein
MNLAKPDLTGWLDIQPRMLCDPLHKLHPSVCYKRAGEKSQQMRGQKLFHFEPGQVGLDRRAGWPASQGCCVTHYTNFIPRFAIEVPMKNRRRCRDKKLCDFRTGR